MLQQDVTQPLPRACCPQGSADDPGRCSCNGLHQLLMLQQAVHAMHAVHAEHPQGSEEDARSFVMRSLADDAATGRGAATISGLPSSLLVLVLALSPLPPALSPAGNITGCDATVVSGLPSSLLVLGLSPLLPALSLAKQQDTQ